METTFFLDSKTDHVQGSSQNLTAYFNSQIQLDRSKAYQIALVNANIWYSWYNTDDTNNMFKYNDIVIKVPSGAYNIGDINRYIKKTIERNGDNPDNINILPNYNTVHSELELKGGYTVDFTIHKSLRTV